MNRRILIYAVIIVIITFSLRASNNMLVTTLPLIAKYYFHFSSVLIGVISSLALLSAFIASGLVNSRLTSPLRREAFIISSIAYAVIFPFFYFSNSYNVWILTSVVGFSLGMVMPNIITSAGLFQDQKTRERMLSLYTLALSTSLILGPLIESAILLRFNLFQAFLFFSIFAGLVALSSFTVKFPNEDSEKRIKVNTWNNHGFRLSIFLNLMYALPFGTLTTFGGIYAVDSFHASYSLATALFGMFFATSFLGRLMMTIFPPRDLGLPIWISASLTIVGLAMVFLSNSLIFYIIALIVLGIPHGLTYPTSLIALTRSFSENERNIANSYFSATMTAFTSFVPIIISSLVSYVGIRYSFALLIPVSLAFFIAVLLSEKRG
ncbi:MFS transporter [Acidianus sp. HS-5]|uniref:MFS transporter n=1 Tax=Acidianus sp. HS-5 TaxID=2886040 RepID=UPI001EFFA0D0|nr:MFS transporter [Acidianus sp. HS-5]BDC18601.1 MFS transporter [Acidianus sp. HS-5]